MPSRFTAITASTAMVAKKSACAPMILLDMVVLAAATTNSRSILSVDTVRLDLMNLTASFMASR